MKTSILILSWVLLLMACNTTQRLTNKAAKLVVNDSALANAHIGISIYDVEGKKYLCNYNAEKYFVPASNTKIATCYAAMKYLGDSLVGLRYHNFSDEYLTIQGTGDPTFFNAEFKNQPVVAFIRNENKKIVLNNNNWQEERWGSGWNWTDFGEDYCQERSVLPMFYNSVIWDSFFNGTYYYYKALPTYFDTQLESTDRTLNRKVNNAMIEKDILDNKFYLKNSIRKFQRVIIPFTTGDKVTKILLNDIFGKEVYISDSNAEKQVYDSSYNSNLLKIYSQPTDSLLKPMMHRSDNFFAEQSLLMVSNEKLGYMNDAAIIEYIKKNDFVGIPQMPRWVDGSGLSRYNMFTPQSIIFILNKMQQEFGMPRIQQVFATGGEGTIANYYKNLQGKIFAKTGTLSNHVALSGYLYTNKGKLLLFSTLVSGYQGSATPIRRAVEKMLYSIYKNN